MSHHEEPTISVLILAKNEAHNLPGCLHTVSWANEVIVLVDKASDDQTEEIARRAMKIAADICVYTNHALIVETLNE